MSIPKFKRDLRLEQRRLAYFKRRKVVRITYISIIVLLIVFFSLYHLTDVIFGPPEGLSCSPLPGEWAMFRHDLGRSGSANSGDTLPQGAVSVLLTTGGAIHSSPTVADGTVYVGSRDYRLYAVDAATGAKLWEFKTGSWVESSPAVVNGVVYFGSNDGRLYALDAATGEKLWDFKSKYALKSSPAVADGIVYFGSSDYYIYALDAVTGKKLWHFETDSLVVSSPVVVNGIVCVGSMDGFFYNLHAGNGRLRLRFKAFSPVVSSPSVSDGVVYFTTSRGSVYAVDSRARNWPRENELIPYWRTLYFYQTAPAPPPPSGFLWTLHLGATTSSSPVVVDGILYICAGSKLISIDIQSQEERWVFEAGGIISASPAVAGTTIYVVTEDGHLYVVDATTGDKLRDIPVGGKITSSPAVADGTVYLGSHDGNLYAIE